MLSEAYLELLGVEAIGSYGARSQRWPEGWKRLLRQRNPRAKVRQSLRTLAYTSSMKAGNLSRGLNHIVSVVLEPLEGDEQGETS